MKNFNEYKSQIKKILLKNSDISVKDVEKIIYKNTFYRSIKIIFNDILLGKSSINEKVYDFLARLLNNFHWLSKKQMLVFFNSMQHFEALNVTESNDIITIEYKNQENKKKTINFYYLFDENIFDNHGNLTLKKICENINKNKYLFISEKFEHIPYLNTGLKASENKWVLQNLKYYLYSELIKKYKSIKYIF